ncbi:WG repeat-containing protein [Chryseobacterium sp. MP_3.2]|uniref:WG repeat-containing protein n=1 Tax=Chryseobacterium sp. MP_3.2 TaxID=3071712 RepID=UPI002E08BFDA|nr:hypothetical protein [Chryseobacterium sp. MP_3.2]
MKNILTLLLLSFSFLFYSQIKQTTAIKAPKKNVVSTYSLDLKKINDSIPSLIPQKRDGLFGFINQHGKLMIINVYSNVGFFTEDCNLLNSPNVKVRKYGSSKYASVRLNDVDYRINQFGKRVYQFKKEDLGKCDLEFKSQLFHAYIMNSAYGIIEDSKFENPGDYRQYTIYPQYDYLHIVEGDDLKKPLIIATKNNKFGVIDINQKVIIPFEYVDVKRNYSWKLARLFEVTKDGKNYYYVDTENNAY